MLPQIQEALEAAARRKHAKAWNNARSDLLAALEKLHELRTGACGWNWRAFPLKICYSVEGKQVEVTVGLESVADALTNLDQDPEGLQCFVTEEIEQVMTAAMLVAKKIEK